MISINVKKSAGVSNVLVTNFSSSIVKVILFTQKLTVRSSFYAIKEPQKLHLQAIF
jgi:hypothetical protein